MKITLTMIVAALAGLAAIAFIEGTAPYVAGLVSGVQRNGFCTDAARLIILAIFVGWALNRIKKRN